MANQNKVGNNTCLSQVGHGNVVKKEQKQAGIGNSLSGGVLRRRQTSRRPTCNSNTLLETQLLGSTLLSALLGSLFFRFPEIPSNLKCRFFDEILRLPAAALQDAACAGAKVVLHHCDGRIGWIGRLGQSTQEQLK